MGVWKGLPWDPSTTKIGRTDQGVDVSSSTPYVAVAAGRVVHIDPNFYNGTPAVYIKLDHPVKVNGRTYKGVYYSETGALVRVGQRVKPGQDVSAPGNAEIGFAAQFGSSSSSWLPAAHNSYREGDTTQAGSDFASTTRGGGSSFWSKLASDVVIPLPGGIPVPAGGVASGVASAADTAAAVGSFLGKLTDPRFILRMVEVVGGALIALLGLYLLAKQVGMGEGGVPDVPVIREVAPPVARASGAVRTRRRARHERQARAQVTPHEGGPRRRVEVSESAQRRARVKELAARAEPSNEIPF